MSAYMLGAIDIADPIEYAKYREGVAEAFRKFGGGVEVLTVDGNPEMLEGKQPGSHLFVVKFPSMESLKAFFRSDDYQEIVHHRHRSSSTAYIMAMRGLDEMTS